MKVLILAAFVALGLSMAGTDAQAQRYRTPAHNYYQNNWMSAAAYLREPPSPARNRTDE
jgi:hypothetical protein